MIVFSRVQKLAYAALAVSTLAVNTMGAGSVLAQGQSTSLRVARIFTDSLVLQRDQPIKIWGWAAPAKKVTVQFQNQKATATAAQDGKWMATLPALSANLQHQDMLISQGKETVQLKGLLVGEVFVASGQSNMEWKLKQKINNYLTEIKQANYPEIRFFDVPNEYTALPQPDLRTTLGKWTPLRPATAPDISAVAYFFAREVHKKYKVPVGLILCEWGGTPAEAWTSQEALRGMGTDFDAALAELAEEQKDPTTVQKRADALMQQWVDAVKKADKAWIPVNGKYWWDKDFNDQDWNRAALPGKWESNGMPGYDGIGYYRLNITLDKVPAGAATLSLGPIDDVDTVFVNGRRVAGGEGWNVPRVYTLPAGTFTQGVNNITVKVLDTGGDGGFTSDDPDKLFLSWADGTRIKLSTIWNFNTSVALSQLPPKPANKKNQNTATVLFNAMLHPIIPYSMKGVIWYQGESNAPRAQQYARLFPTMIKDWRSRWGQGEFPFLFVQLANYRAEEALPIESDWAELREAQTKTLALPNTGMACIIDIGEAADIHPRNKQDVGLRLFKAAQKVVYKEQVLHSGATYKTQATQGNALVLSFDNLGAKGLINRNKYGYVRGFALAGADGKWHWAQAQIRGTEVVVSSAAVPAPQFVRYAWANNPGDLDLYNEDGLPMVPFRTDFFPGITK